jgi:hypothetical protein
VPFYDPYEIFHFAQSNGSLDKVLDGGLVVYNFQFNLDSFHLYKIAFSFDTTSGQKYLVQLELVYERLGVKVSDTINYIRLYVLKPKHYVHINDYVNIQGNKFELKDEFSKFTLFNLY